MRRRTGIFVLAATLAGGSYAAWALQPAELDRAPALIGSVVPGQLAVVDVRKVRESEPIDIMGGAMGNADGSDLRVFMDARRPLRVSVGQGPSRLVFQAEATGHQGDAVVHWTLVRAGRLVDQGVLRLTAEPKTLTIGGPAQQLASTVSLQFRAQSGPGMVEVGTGAFPLRNDRDGGYTDVHGSDVYTNRFKASGVADLLLHVSSLGTVDTVEIERVTPPGAFSLQDARNHVRDMRFSPQIVGGKPIPSRIRMSVRFAPTPPTPTAVEDPSGDQSDRGPQGIAMRPPAYPKEAFAGKVDGRVVLELDIDVAGKVKHATVVSAEPAGIFDQAALQAAMAWTFRPRMEGGKPVAGRVHVPITFEANAVEANREGTISVPRGTDPSAFDWIEFDPLADTFVQEMKCDLVSAETDSDLVYCGRRKRAASVP